MALPTIFRRSLIAIALGVTVSGTAAAQERELLNSSYDIARELFAAINPEFQAWWQEEHGEEIAISQSHGGSSAQARAILQGLRADVVTFNQVTDVQVLADAGLVAEDWQDAFENNASPYYSTTAFLVRKGNPKGIESWDDLVKEDVQMVFPNPKTSGNGRYTYLAAWGFAENEFDGDEEQIEEFMRTFLANVAVFDTGGRGATTSFIEREIGDVLISFESEVNNIRKEYGSDDYEVIVPPVSILAEFPVAVVGENAERNGNSDLAQNYLEYLYTEETQRLLAGFNYRVHNEAVVEEFADQFPETELLEVDEVFGSWDEAMETHFEGGGLLDQLQRR
ncbi:MULTISPECIES: thiosulfate ABC transporter substrate-binding protein CysP [Halomonadaceae]|jgi:sulfate/thiosulfate transport system substrate-binding protein|uniref:Thiosulfate-binding protein n=1 Tax=Vreelandella titanicae TaxID=664683 RepID=A0A653UHV2_9GAMM|nr:MULTISPECIES: thiosulfate ABC transporter substrate-binding protein CysP [Halomonas]QKS24240.1 Thiosulfate-binding protein [Halomonas titanicae]CAD5246870.1 thiosulfate transporter subunit; periplasmic-binding component of ABC superfamily [Halomonas sp. 59]CAD5247007.1 thiosulfate transporter subunit; periplasmic-binding component of ABC superfamily [Halomonas sp. 113]CAD5252877.1 thiosulfate transporter subunit; periplasmic-binding component of ABC superfamily [Halomonas sp. 156]CAD5289803|eukprot:TRINITY_DN46363_c0_g1_i1.p1 TRINITY_DN46363_c0_g1~~TRINITY_DN46363_c0_g1_i1.p1  ORF type:complete len:344 (+),score=35.37 TRINITY_DN46363_c0_g1_i1:22-1032(+)